MSLTEKKAIHQPRPFSSGNVYGLEALTISQGDQPLYDIFVPPEGKPLASRRALRTQVNPWGEEVEAVIATEKWDSVRPDPDPKKDLAHTHYLRVPQGQDGEQPLIEDSGQKWYSSTFGRGSMTDSVDCVEEEVADRSMVEFSDPALLDQDPISVEPVGFDDQQWMSRLARADHLLNALNHSNPPFNRFNTDNPPDLSSASCFLEDSPLLEKVPPPELYRVAPFSGKAVKRPEKRKADQELADLKRVRPDLIIYQQIEGQSEAGELNLETAAVGPDREQPIDDSPFLPVSKLNGSIVAKQSVQPIIPETNPLELVFRGVDHSTQASVQNPTPDPLEVIQLSPHLDPGEKSGDSEMEIRIIVESESAEKPDPDLESERSEQGEPELATGFEEGRDSDIEAERSEQGEPELDGKFAEKLKSEPVLESRTQPPTAVSRFNPLDELTLDEFPANSDSMEFPHSTVPDHNWDELDSEDAKPSPPRRLRRVAVPRRSAKKRSVKPVLQKTKIIPTLASKKMGFYFYAGMNVLRRISASAIEGYLSSMTLDDRSRNHYYMERGIHYFNVGHIRRAAQYFESILDSHPEIGEVKARLGLCYLEMKQLEKATTFLEQAQAHGCMLDLDEKLALAYSRRGDDAKAVENLVKALENFPNKFELHYRLGLSLDNLGEYLEAARSFENALEIDPKNVKVCRSLGYTYERAGDSEKAVTYFKKAKQLENDRLDHFVGVE
ncbi:MAG: tetratricopeptide repeat protein [Magnetococcales bacterium]|nr:tetratricopeptide repeat protein [Magnetococcales bacterium]